VPRDRADHGNAEQMLEPDGVSPHTAHTTNPVPLVLTSDRVELRRPVASDLAPTILGCSAWGFRVT
jgi:2,3-bisphosphoglycerate-independent phosphoglycerate mutase